MQTLFEKLLFNDDEVVVSMNRCYKVSFDNGELDIYTNENNNPITSAFHDYDTNEFTQFTDEETYDLAENTFYLNKTLATQKKITYKNPIKSFYEV